MLNKLTSYLEKIKSFFVKRRTYCVECEIEKETRYCKHCQKETGDLFKLNLSETVKVGESLGIKQKQSGIKKYIKKMFQGYQSSINTKKHPEGVERHVSIDRENNWYDETVQDNKTGKIFRDIHEPLSQHVSNAQKNKGKRKWYQFVKMDRREYGYTAIVGLLAGGIFQSSIIGSVLGLAGLVSAICWIVLTIKHKFFEPRETVIASNTLNPNEIKKILGEDANNLSNEEAQKRFMELPVEKQWKAFFGKKS